MAAAILSAGKMAFAVIPNIEVVTLFIMLFACVFKPQVCFISTIIFIAMETLIWGLASWVISYIIHWNFISLATYFMANVLHVRNKFIYFAFVLIVTTMFGVLTSFVDALIAWDKTGKSFGLLFTAIYMRGCYFYISHIVGNGIINLLLFAPLRTLLEKLTLRYYGGGTEY